MEKIEIIDQDEIHQNIEVGYYDVNSYMKRPPYPDNNAIQKQVRDTFRGTFAEIEAEVTKQQKKAKINYTRQLREYTVKESVLLDELFEDLAMLYEVTGCAKLPLLITKVKRYSDTKEEMVNNFAFLVELIVPTRADKIDTILSC